jgi:polar amino acid transport system substrate-binding protein
MAFPSMLIKPRHPEKQRAMVRVIGRLAALAGLALLILPAGGATPAPPRAPLIFGTDAVDTNEFGSKWATLAYTEAFRRLALAVQINHYPLARRAALVEAGEIDGDVARIREYGDAHPSLVRVEESFADLNFALFTANPALQLRTLEELRPSSWQVEFRRGILFCERTLKPLLPAERLSDISSEEQGVKKLLAGRTDLYCDLDYAVRRVLHLPSFKNATPVRKVFDLGVVPTYPYLHRKHAALAPLLAATLKKMKAEGLIEAYRVQVEKELGWLP